MKRLVVITLTLVVLALVLLLGAYLFDQYWIHRYDSLIAREAAAHRIDSDLVWSITYEETHFRPWLNGKNGEIGLMQVTPAVARAWATETEHGIGPDMATLLHDPEHNIQIGCWYLEKFSDEYHDASGREARMLAAYNAGDSRAIEWNRVAPGARPLTEQEFIARIDIPSTRAYVNSILARYNAVKAARHPSPARAKTPSGANSQ
jgi:soluble lytic murein transglycosylase